MLRHVAVGSAFLQFVYIDQELSHHQPYDLTSTTLITGRNGTGKTTMLDVFSFIRDCLSIGVEDACLLRGGYESLYSQGSTGPISFGFNFRITPNTRVLTYAVILGVGAASRPYVDTELLAYRSENPEEFGVPILFFQNGEKIVRHLLTDGKLSEDISKIEQTDMRHLALATLGEHKDYPVVGMVKNFFNDYYRYGTSLENKKAFLTKIDTEIPLTQHERGSDLASHLRYLQKTYPDHFTNILSRVSRKFPDVSDIEVEIQRLGRVALAVKKKKFSIPFQANQLSEGFMKLMNYYLLLENPSPPMFIGLDEPENGLDFQSMKTFMNTLSGSSKSMGSAQFLITAHLSSLANWLSPNEVWILEQDREGFTQVQRGSDYPIIREMLANNQPIGEAWYSDFYDQSWMDSL